MPMLKRNGALRIALLYSLIGTLWIALSDKIVFLLYGPDRTPLIHFISSAKGFAFVILTGFLLYLLIRRHNNIVLRNEKRYRSYFEENPDPMWIYDRDTLHFEKVNNAAIANYGYSREEFLSMTILDIRPPGEAEELKRQLNDFRKQPYSMSGTWTHRKKDGTLIHVNITSHAVSNRYADQVIVMAKDTTTAKQLEEERNKYLLRLEDTLNSISDAFFILDRDWIIRAVNPMFSTVTGFTKEQVLDRKFPELWPHAHGPAFYEHFSTAITEKVTVKFEAFSLLLQKWLRLSCYPVKDGIAVYFSDITESKEKDVLLKQALERYDLASRATSDMFYDYDMVNNKVLYSRDFDAIINPLFRSEEDPTKAWFSIIHPEDIAKVIAMNQESIKNHRSKYECEYRVDFGGGHYRYVCDQAFIQYEKGNPVRMVGAIRDINELKQTAEENKRLSEVISKVHNMVMITNTKREIVWINRAFEEVSGYTLAEISGKKPQHVIGGPNPDPDLVADITNRSARQEVFAKELPFYNRQQKILWAIADFTPLYNDKNEHTGYTAVYSDISLLKEKEASLLNQNATLREIAWMESHEMRKPLSSILGLAELIRMSTDEEEKKHLFELLDSCAKELDSKVLVISQKIQKGIGK